MYKRQWEYLSVVSYTTIAPMVAGVVSSTIAMIAVSLLTQARYPVSKEILDLIDEASKIRPIPDNMLNKSSALTIESVELERHLREKK